MLIRSVAVLVRPTSNSWRNIAVFVRFNSTVTSSNSRIPSGLCAVYKPKGWTSNDVVQKIKGILLRGSRENGGKAKKRDLKIGHGGTLDPVAAGVLVLGVGEGTKLLKEYLSGSKGYTATALLGQEMDTQDSTGKVTATQDCSHVSHDSIIAALPKFRGDIMQTPPMFSALKQDGHKLYDLARKGVTVDRPARPMTVYQLELLHGPESKVQLPLFQLELECSGGFYVRTLVSDLAKEAGGVAHTTELERTKQGVFTTGDCMTLEQLTFESFKEHLVQSSAKAKLDVSKLKPAYELKADSK